MATLKHARKARSSANTIKQSLSQKCEESKSKHLLKLTSKSQLSLDYNKSKEMDESLKEYVKVSDPSIKKKKQEYIHVKQ